MAINIMFNEITKFTATTIVSYGGKNSFIQITCLARIFTRLCSNGKTIWIYGVIYIYKMFAFKSHTARLQEIGHVKP